MEKVECQHCTDWHNPFSVSDTPEHTPLFEKDSDYRLLVSGCFTSKQLCFAQDLNRVCQHNKKKRTFTAANKLIGIQFEDISVTPPFVRNILHYDTTCYMYWQKNNSNDEAIGVCRSYKLLALQRKAYFSIQQNFAVCFFAHKASFFFIF